MVIRVFAIDEAKVTIEGLLKSLAEFEDIKIVGSSNNPKQSQKKIKLYSPNVVLMEGRFSNYAGSLLAHDIIKQEKKTRVLVYSSFDEEQQILELVEAGVHGYILKRDEISQLVKAIRVVAQGKTWFSPEIAHVVLHGVKKKTLADYGLSSREQEVFMLITNGHTNREIASKLFIAEGTVKNHVFSIYKKLVFSNRLEAIRWAINNGFTEN